MYRHITSIRMNMVTLRSGLLASKFQGSTSILQPCSQHFAFYWSPLLRTNGILLSFHSKKHLFGMVSQSPTHIFQMRTFSYGKLKGLIFPKDMKKHDNVGSHYDIVYKTETTSYLQLGMGGIQAVAGMFVCIAGAMACGFHPPHIELLLESPVCSAIFFIFNVIICLGLLKIISTHPMRIYYNENEDHFIAVFVGKHPLDVRLLNIQPGEVKPQVLSSLVEKLVPWSFGFCTTPTQKIFLNEHNFRYPVYYNKLLGYDKF